MKKNMGGNDRLIRSLTAAVVAVLYMTDVITGLTGLILLAVAAVFVLTSFVSICPLYRLFGIRTCAVQKES